MTDQTFERLERWLAEHAVVPPNHIAADLFAADLVVDTSVLEDDPALEFHGERPMVRVHPADFVDLGRRLQAREAQREVI
jgi:hypothetical protein